MRGREKRKKRGGGETKKRKKIIIKKVNEGEKNVRGRECQAEKGLVLGCSENSPETALGW